MEGAVALLAEGLLVAGLCAACLQGVPDAAALGFDHHRPPSHLLLVLAVVVGEEVVVWRR